MNSFVWLRFGSNGKQLAEVIGTTPSGLVKVRKYRANSRRWTGIVTVPPSAYIAPATVAESGRAIREARS